MLKAKISNHNFGTYFNPYTLKFSNDDLLVINKYTQKHPNNPQKLKIYFGNACNFRCKYCRQNQHNKKEEFSKNKCDEFIKKIKNNIIEWWGGEPLLYWQEILYLTEKLGIDFTHHMTTNGSLLNENIVQFILDHDFIFKLSHDGPLNFLRTYDVLKNDKFIHKIYNAKIDKQQFYINSVYTNSKIRISDIVDYFINVFDDRVQIMKIEPVIPYNEWSSEYNIELDLQEFSKNLEEDLLYTDIMNHVQEYMMMYRIFVKNYNNPRYRYNPFEAKCIDTQNTTLSITFDGIITPCQVWDSNSAGILGSIDDFKNINELPPYTVSTKNRCNNCPVISLCRGTCPYIKESFNDNLNCKTRFFTYKAMLKAFMFKYLDFYISDIDGDYFYKNEKW